MISIIVVTYDRKLLLRKCLESILASKANEKFEIIVVDNYSSDGTEIFVKNIFGDKIKFLKNRERLSLPACKMLGVKLATGEKIAFIDDDCLASKHWLNEIEKSLTGCDFVGGAVLPTADVKFPHWWNKSLDWLIGINPNPGKKFLPLGSNIAFNKRALDMLQEDENNITLRDNQYLPYAEDNYRIRKALRLGFSLKINLNMIVYHQITGKRLKLAYLITRSYNEGRASVSYENKPGDLFFSFILLPCNFVKLFVTLDIGRIFRMICSVSYILHYMRIKLTKKH